mgnify:CR=1 FL=1
MAFTHTRSKRKITGGRYRDFRKKKLRDLARVPANTKLDEKKVVKIRKLGGFFKNLQLSNNTANVYNPETKKYAQSKILTVVNSQANRNFVRRNIMTKGAIIKTELGEAKITSRPGQEAQINAVLIKK